MLSESLFQSVKSRPVNLIWIFTGVMAIFISKSIEGTFFDAAFFTTSMACFPLLVISIYDFLARVFFQAKLFASYSFILGLAIVLLLLLSQFTGGKEVLTFIGLAIFVSIVLVGYKLLNSIK